MRRPFALLCMALLVIAGGCSIALKEASPPKKAKEVNLNQVKAALQQRGDAFHDLKATARVNLRTAEVNANMRQIFLLQKGPFLRMETLDFFGQPSVYFTSNQEGINIYYPDRGVFFVGKPTSENIFNLLGIEINASDLVMLLTGNVPENKVHGIETLSYLTGEGAYLYAQFYQGGPYTERLIRVSPGKLNPLMVSFHGPDTLPLLKVEYGKYKDVDGYELPTEVTITQPVRELRITIQYTSLEANKGISETAFLLPVPQGVEVISLDR